MKKRIIRYLKHILITIPIVAIMFFTIGIMSGNHVKYGRNNMVSNYDGEGPYVFFGSDSLLSINYIRGDYETGFELQEIKSPTDSIIEIISTYSLDSSTFNFKLNSNIKIPNSRYSDNEKIFAVSDIESNFGTFRDLLINHQIIDSKLNWTFNKGHLVLVGDFIDRSYFTTQVLWFIYYLEREAEKQGGKVHYIIGNHEIMNMQGNHSYAKSKYNNVASVLGKRQFELYDTKSFIGKWMQSKNTIELINGNLFVHGGIHPQFSEINMDLDELNTFIRKNYYKPYYPERKKNKERELILSSKTAPYWYRGYFRDDLTPEEIKRGHNKFGASTVIVGHTIQSKVKSLHNGLVIGIDVKHPQDYYKYFPKPESQGLLIENGIYYRAMESGNREKIK